MRQTPELLSWQLAVSAACSPAETDLCTPVTMEDDQGLLTVPAAGAAGAGAGSESPNRSRAGAAAVGCIVPGATRAGLAPLEDTPRDAAMLGLTLTWTHQSCVKPTLLFNSAQRE